MSQRNLIDLTSMDFDEIKQSLKDFLKTQSTFTDYNFEGSGLNVMLDTLSYNSQNKAYLANMLANEAFLDSAIIRSNIVSAAKSLGYTPRSRVASRAVISIAITDPSNGSLSLLLPRGTKFTSGSSGSEQYTFVTLQDYNLMLDEESGIYFHNEIEIYEGFIRTFSWDVSEGFRYIIPSTDIDISTVKLALYDSVNAASYTAYEQVDGVRNITGESPVYWLSETDGRRYEIKFGDNVFGKKPINNSLIYAEYLTTKGPLANDLSTFSLSGSFAGYTQSQISLSTVGASAGGTTSESTESIKINAPRKFSSKGKAVTPEDYKSVIAEIYPYTKAVEVWGGEDIRPVQYGKVFISIIPQNVSKLTNTNKEFILRKLRQSKVVGIQPELVDPTFTNINLSMTITVKRNYLDNIPVFADKIGNIIREYFETNFGMFDNIFYYTNLTTLVDNFSRSIVSSKGDFTLSQIGDKKTKEYKFFNELVPGSVRTSKILLVGDIKNVTAKDDGHGKLLVGEREIGTVDYKSGLVHINVSEFSTQFVNFVEVFVETQDDDVVPGFANALVLDPRRLTIQFKAV